MKKEIRLYNMIFPLWLLIWIPSYLWFFLIPVNYLIDSLVLCLSLKDHEDRKRFCLKHSWKICIAGFLADLIGSASLLIAVLNMDQTKDLVDFVTYNPLANVLSFLIVIIAVLISAICIYLSDRWILLRTGLDIRQAKKSAFCMALFTAPYLFLIPTQWFFGWM